MDQQESLFFKNLIASGVAALISRTVCYPIDTIKTNLQNNKKNLSWKAAFKRQGNLFQGLGPTLSLSVPAMAIYLSSYDQSKDVISRHTDWAPNGFGTSIISGIIAEAASGVLFVPMEVLKEKLQVSRTNQTVFQLISSLYKSHGLYGFYRGFGLTMSVYVPYSVTYFVTYEKLKTFFLERDPRVENLSFGTHLGCAFVSAALGAAVSNPMDVVHTRAQIATTIPTKTIIRDMYYREGGLRPFGKGLMARVLWAAPSMSLTIALWEMAKIYLF
jgi:hypothetical protein